MPMSEENVVVEEVAVEATSEETPAVEEQATPSLLDEFSYQYNKEDQKPQSMEELKELAEMGRYYKEQGKKSVDFVKSYAKKNNMSIDELLVAIEEQEKYNEIQKIASEQNVTEDVAKKLYKADILEEQFANEQRTKAEQKKIDDQMAAFVDKFPDVKEIKQEVWDKVNEGKLELVEAYEFFNKDSKIQELTDKLAKYEQTEQIDNKNAENANAATGSVTGNGSTDSLFSRGQVKNMSRSEVKKNYSKVLESMKSWK